MPAWIYEGKVNTNKLIGNSGMLDQYTGRWFGTGYYYYYYYYYYKKAFDTVPHQELLQKLKGLKLGDTLTK